MKYFVLGALLFSPIVGQATQAVKEKTEVGRFMIVQSAGDTYRIDNATGKSWIKVVTDVNGHALQVWQEIFEPELIADLKARK